MYLIADTKLYNINIYERHIELLVLNFYLVVTPIVFVYIQIKLFWEYYYNITLLITFIDNYKYWFYNKYLFT